MQAIIGKKMAVNKKDFRVNSALVKESARCILYQTGTLVLRSQIDKMIPEGFLEKDCKDFE